MRIHYLAAVMAVAAPGAMGQSQSQDYPMTGGDALSTVRVTAPQPGFEASLADTDWISGAYRMSNGWRMDVQPHGGGIVARIDKERPMRLIALSADHYMTMDGNVALAFNRGARGDEMLMSYVPRSNLAARVVVGSTLAAR